MRPSKQADKRVSVSAWSIRLPIAIKRVLVTPTSQLVVAQVEVCERSQLAELGWDAT